MRKLLCLAVSLSLALFLLAPSLPAHQAKGTSQIGVVRIAMIQSLFRGRDPATLLALTQPFGELLYTQTGIRGDFCISPDVADVGERLQRGDVQLAVLHGVEYGWLREKQPDVQPLALAFNQTIHLKALVIVRNDNPARKLSDLKGKRCCLPTRSLNHCFLYLHKAITDEGHVPTGFFQPGPTTARVDYALDYVYEGTVALTVIDGVSWEVYRSHKPGRAARLRILCESPVFPTAAIVYRPAGADPILTKQFVERLSKAHETAFGRQLLTLWRISGFSSVPADYNAMVDNILKEFPKPLEPADFFAQASGVPNTATGR